jgi:hypothetical protein
MKTHLSPQAGQIQRMRHGCSSTVGACGAIFAVVSIFVGIQVSVSTAWSGTAPAGQIVDRTGKGDRLPLVPAFHANEGSQPVEFYVRRTPDTDQQLLDGCESLASPLSYSPSAQIAGRCVS